MVYIWRNTIRKVLIIISWQVRDCDCRHIRQDNASLSRCVWPLLVRSLATPASLMMAFPKIRHRCLRVAFWCRLRSLAGYSIVFHTMSEKHPKQIKGFGRKRLSYRRHFSLSCVAIGKRHKSGKSPPGPTTSDSDAMADAKNWTSEQRQLQRTPVTSLARDIDPWEPLLFII